MHSARLYNSPFSNLYSISLSSLNSLFSSSIPSSPNSRPCRNYVQPPVYQQPQQQVYTQQGGYVQVPPQAQQPAQPQYVNKQQDDVTIERPSDKSVPKFARLLKNLGRRGDE